MTHLRSFFVAATFFAATTSPQGASASSCCAGSAAMPAMITGDHASQVSLAVSNRTMSLDAATLLSDRWQVGTSLPLGSQGLGDIRIGGAFEALPEYSYSAWKPRGYLITQLRAPSGTSAYTESGLVSPTATGEGFWTPSAGLLLVKRGSIWDASLLNEFQLALGRSFENPEFDELNIGSQWSNRTWLGLGISPGAGDFRFGVRVGATYLSAREQTWAESSLQTQTRWDAPYGLDTTYLFNSLWAATASYTVPNSWTQTFGVSLQRRWDR